MTSNITELKTEQLKSIARLTSSLADVPRNTSNFVSSFSQAVPTISEFVIAWDEYRVACNPLDELMEEYGNKTDCSQINGSAAFLKSLIDWNLQKTELEILLEQVPERIRSTILQAVQDLVSNSQANIADELGELS